MQKKQKFFIEHKQISNNQQNIIQYNNYQNIQLKFQFFTFSYLRIKSHLLVTYIIIIAYILLFNILSINQYTQFQILLLIYGLQQQVQCNNETCTLTHSQTYSSSIFSEPYPSNPCFNLQFENSSTTIQLNSSQYCNGTYTQSNGQYILNFTINFDGNGFNRNYTVYTYENNTFNLIINSDLLSSPDNIINVEAPINPNLQIFTTVCQLNQNQLSVITNNTGGCLPQVMSVTTTSDTTNATLRTCFYQEINYEIQNDNIFNPIFQVSTPAIINSETDYKQLNGTYTNISADINLYLDSTLYQATSTNAQLSFTIANLSVGQHDFYAIYRDRCNTPYITTTQQIYNLRYIDISSQTQIICNTTTQICNQSFNLTNINYFISDQTPCSAFSVNNQTTYYIFDQFQCSFNNETQIMDINYTSVINYQFTENTNYNTDISFFNNMNLTHGVCLNQITIGVTTISVDQQLQMYDLSCWSQSLTEETVDTFVNDMYYVTNRYGCQTDLQLNSSSQDAYNYNLTVLYPSCWRENLIYRSYNISKEQFQGEIVQSESGDYTFDITDEIQINVTLNNPQLYQDQTTFSIMINNTIFNPFNTIQINETYFQLIFTNINQNGTITLFMNNSYSQCDQIVNRSYLINQEITVNQPYAILQPFNYTGVCTNYSTFSDTNSIQQFNISTTNSTCDNLNSNLSNLFSNGINYVCEEAEQIVTLTFDYTSQQSQYLSYYCGNITTLTDGDQSICFQIQNVLEQCTDSFNQTFSPCSNQNQDNIFLNISEIGTNTYDYLLQSKYAKNYTHAYDPEINISVNTQQSQIQNYICSSESCNRSLQLIVVLNNPQNYAANIYLQDSLNNIQILNQTDINTYSILYYNITLQGLLTLYANVQYQFQGTTCTQEIAINLGYQINVTRDISINFTQNNYININSWIYYQIDQDYTIQFSDQNTISGFNTTNYNQSLIFTSTVSQCQITLSIQRINQTIHARNNQYCNDDTYYLNLLNQNTGQPIILSLCQQSQQICFINQKTLFLQIVNVPSYIECIQQITENSLTSGQIVQNYNYGVKCQDITSNNNNIANNQFIACVYLTLDTFCFTNDTQYQNISLFTITSELNSFNDWIYTPLYIKYNIINYANRGLLSSSNISQLTQYVQDSLQAYKDTKSNIFDIPVTVQTLTFLDNQRQNIRNSGSLKKFLRKKICEGIGLQQFKYFLNPLQEINDYKTYTNKDLSSSQAKKLSTLINQLLTPDNHINIGTNNQLQIGNRYLHYQDALFCENKIQLSKFNLTIQRNDNFTICANKVGVGVELYQSSKNIDIQLFGSPQKLRIQSQSKISCKNGNQIDQYTCDLTLNGNWQSEISLKEKLTGGEIAAIVIGVIVFVAILIIIIICINNKGCKEILKQKFIYKSTHSIIDRQIN